MIVIFLLLDISSPESLYPLLVFRPYLVLLLLLRQEVPLPLEDGLPTLPKLQESSGCKGCTKGFADAKRQRLHVGQSFAHPRQT